MDCDQRCRCGLEPRPDDLDLRTTATGTAGSGAQLHHGLRVIRRFSPRWMILGGPWSVALMMASPRRSSAAEPPRLPPTHRVPGLRSWRILRVWDRPLSPAGGLLGT